MLEMHLKHFFLLFVVSQSDNHNHAVPFDTVVNELRHYHITLLRYAAPKGRKI